MNNKALDLALERAEALCHERGLQLTEQRRIVLQLLCQSGKPLSAYELLEQLRDVFKNPAPPTVYRALNFLIEQGLVHKLESLHAYIGCVHPEHPHTSQFLICDDCGEVAEVADPGVARSLVAAGQAVGFRTRQPMVELLGTCAQCAAEQDKRG